MIYISIMELRHLRYFVAVAEEMNIHRAAERLNISQPPLSLTIKQLEEELEVTLFNRVGRGIEITRSGRFFLERAKAILSKVDKAVIATKHIHEGKSGTIKIHFISSAVTGILQSIVSKQRVCHPDIDLDLQQSTANKIFDDLLTEDIDIGIIRLPLPLNLPEGLEVVRVSSESWFVAINTVHPLAQKERVDVEDLSGEPLIVNPRWNSPIAYDDMIKYFQERGVEPYIIQEATEQMTIAGLVASGIGIGVVPQCMSQIKVDGVTHKKLVGTKGMTGFCLAIRDDHDVLVDSFLKTIEEEVA